jgi:hypothetical protein
MHLVYQTHVSIRQAKGQRVHVSEFCDGVWIPEKSSWPRLDCCATGSYSGKRMLARAIVALKAGFPGKLNCEKGMIDWPNCRRLLRFRVVVLMSKYDLCQLRQQWQVFVRVTNKIWLIFEAHDGGLEVSSCVVKNPTAESTSDHNITPKLHYHVNRRTACLPSS